ncbi:universal stress protein [Natronococcus pandeyae]|uniref:Universal stress protein n=1 Tax=Natronococcus pandeyae TaxID=2055836 RepID=A0A8J8TNC4_9EURY|nr:universal stress protein [Natronococcus pandeyae]TYL36516.1 universal stress protein [Natronococcus pandeyae]
MYDDVLIATDGSDVAANAATVGISLARTLGATVHALSVVDEQRGDDAARRDRREADAESIATDAADAGRNADSIVRSGRPATEILTCADEIGAGLIVVGTHGRTGIRQVVLGSVALEVIREARQPVLSVAPDASWDEGARVDNVCLATDGWKGSRAATDHALSVAEAADAELHALYAVDVPSSVPEMRDGFEEHGEKTTTDVVTRAEERDLEATGTVVHGTAHETILEYVEDEAVDVLVMGTEGKSNLERLVIGSVSQRVVPNATVPVLTVRATRNRRAGSAALVAFGPVPFHPLAAPVRQR